MIKKLQFDSVGPSGGLCGFNTATSEMKPCSVIALTRTPSPKPVFPFPISDVFASSRCVSSNQGCSSSEMTEHSTRQPEAGQPGGRSRYVERNMREEEGKTKKPRYHVSLLVSLSVPSLLLRVSQTV
ncbi:hypothetical protein GBF38_015931 [Nibea albiflora]|uniref:Uncharacterized protein n=1 Tax=Nibea albiflora TaxID=240163 RepID=A0ACB7FIT9_NIBAL|nr:hypothetical protein GBF38_015931 [Nibea albiflora]